MKKITYLVIFLIGISIVMASTIDRTASTTTPTPGQVVTITYKAVPSVSGNWFVPFHDELNGCQFTTEGGTLIESFMYKNGIDILDTKTFQITAPQSGTCNLQNGYYQFTNENQIAFPTLTITVGGTCTNECTLGTKECINTTHYKICGMYDIDICKEWSSAIACTTGTCQAGNCGTCTDTCSSLGYNCGTQTVCGQSISCGTCQTGYTCSSGVCTVIPVNCGNGNIDTGEDCDKTNLNNKACTDISGFTGGTLSCTSACKFDTSQCTGEPTCEDFYKQWSNEEGKCVTASWVYIIGVILAFFMIIRMMK